MKRFFGALLSKTAAFGILVVVCVALVFGAVLPILDRYQSLNEEILSKKVLLGRLMEQNARPAAEAGPQAARYLPGETDMVRLAGLQSILNEASQEQSIQLISSRSVDAVDQQGIRLLGVAAQFKAPLEKLQRLLLDLEDNRGALVVESLQVLRQSGDAARDSLDVNIVLRGTAPLRPE